MRNLTLPGLFIIIMSCSGQQVKSFLNGPIELFYEEYGAGPALYILTGGPGEPPTYYPYRQIVDSLKAFYNVVLLHQRGSGKSRDIPINQNTISIQNYITDIELLQKNRGDKKVTLVGVSWGGLLAMSYAAKHPRSVAKLVLVCSAPPSYKLWNVLYDTQFTRRTPEELDSMKILQAVFSTKTEKELDSLKQYDPLCNEVLAFKLFMAIHIRAMYFDRSKISLKHFDELFYNFNFQPIAFIDREILSTKWDITSQLRRIRTPALIIYGRQDDQGESTFYLQKDCLRNSEMHVIEQCGHRILDEQPELFFNILLSSVNRPNRGQ